MSIKIILGIGTYILLGWLLCYIDPYESYSWYSGIWHGAFFVPNLLKSLLWNTPYKAEICTTGYTVFFRLLSILSILSCLGIREYKTKGQKENNYLTKINNTKIR